jgi:sulfate adenylyltransferase
VLPLLPPGEVRLALLPLAMRLGGPREAVLHGIIRRNYGCTHLVVGRDHAGPGRDRHGRPFYPPYAAQELFRRYEREIGVAMLAFRDMVYLPDTGGYVPEDEVPPGARVQTLSGTELRRRLARGEEIPRWFTPDTVAAELRRAFRAPREMGLTILLTGLPASGKSTLARALRVALEARGRRVTLLEGDAVRRQLSPRLGFSREDRDENLRRIGFVASEITRHGGTAVCAPIAPYEAARSEVRRMVEAVGGFVLVHVSTPLETCEHRDGKGLYALARAGRLGHFTGVSDPYEIPADADITIDMGKTLPEEAAGRVLERLARDGYLADPPRGAPEGQP